MLIRQKDGLYAGQVREFPSHIGRELIASGRGENPFAEAPTAESFAHLGSRRFQPAEICKTFQVPAVQVDQVKTQKAVRRSR